MTPPNELSCVCILLLTWEFPLGHEAMNNVAASQVSVHMLLLGMQAMNIVAATRKVSVLSMFNRIVCRAMFSWL